MFFILFMIQTVLANNYLNLGDRLWCQGEYSDAMKQWKKAADGEDAAITAMANYRMLLKASNLGWVYYGLQGDLALAECSLDDPRCALANVDRELFMSRLHLPADLEYALDIAKQVENYLPTEALARLVWLDYREKEYLETVEEPDGMGACLLQHEDWPAGPGGAYYGFGLYGGGRLGIGGSASWTQPNIDNAGGQLQLSLALTTQLAGGFYLNYYSAGKRWIKFNSSLSRSSFYLYENALPQFHLVEIAYMELSPGFQVKNGYFWGGIYGRIDQFTDSKYSVGPTLGGVWRPFDTVQWQGDASYTWFDYQYLRIDNRLMWISPSGLALMLNLDMTPVSEAKEEGLWWRMPTLGGGTMLRTAPAHRWRDDFLPSAVFEYRWKPEAPLGIVAFSEITYAEEAIHGGGGLGLRIRMPPQPYNTMRFDIGYGDQGWNVLFGAEEFFRFQQRR